MFRTNGVMLFVQFRPKFTNPDSFHQTDAAISDGLRDFLATWARLAFHARLAALGMTRVAYSRVVHAGGEDARFTTAAPWRATQTKPTTSRLCANRLRTSHGGEGRRS